MSLNIDHQLANTEATVSLTGRLDTATAPELESVLESLFPSITALIFDMEKLEYISSAGLRVILKAQKAMEQRGSLKLVRVPEGVMEVFGITGFRDFLDIENG